jgi:hypothetical protein
MQIEDPGLDEWARRQWAGRHGRPPEWPADEPPPATGCWWGLVLSALLWTLLVASCILLENSL